MRQQFLLSLLFALLGTVSAQFNFFEQMFGGQGGGGGGHHHHQQQQQNAPSDSSWYRSQVDRGIISQYIHSLLQENFKANKQLQHSPLRELPLPRHARVRTLPTPLPLRMAQPRGQVRVGGRSAHLRFKGRVQGRGGGQESRASEEGAAVKGCT